MARSRNRYTTGLTVRTVSVRLGDDDASKLAELCEELAGADPRSEIAEELRSYRGVHDSYNAPLREGQVIRWAIGRALETLPVDRMTGPEIRQTV